MANKVSLINNLTFGLPVNVARPLYQEYSNRRREIDRIWATPENKYKMLQDYVSTVEALLAISLFYRQVLGHIQGATSFYKSVNANNGNASACSIKVGNIYAIDYLVDFFNELANEGKLPDETKEYLNKAWQEIMETECHQNYGMLSKKLL